MLKYLIFIISIFDAKINIIIHCYLDRTPRMIPTNLLCFICHFVENVDTDRAFSGF